MRVYKTSLVQNKLTTYYSDNQNNLIKWSGPSFWSIRNCIAKDDNAQIYNFKLKINWQDFA